MEIVIDKVCFDGIIKPGDLYILHAERDKRFEAGPIEDLYLIRCEREIVAAVDMEIRIYMGFELRKFNGVAKVGDECYKLDLECYDPEQKEERRYPLYLYRVDSFGEMLDKAKKIFGVE